MAKLTLPRLLTIAQELKIPQDRQRQLVDTALKTGNPEKYLRDVAADLAAGNELPPALPDVAPPAVAVRAATVTAEAAAATLAEDDNFFLQALEEILIKAATRLPIEKVSTTHAIIVREFTPHEQRVFQHLRLDDREVLREWHRCQNLIRAEAAAGTAEERIAARARAAAAAQKVEGTNCAAAQLQRQIDALAQQLSALNREHDQAQAEVQLRDAAVQKILDDTTNENMLAEPRRRFWPREGAVAYTESHVGKEPGRELVEPPRVYLGASRPVEPQEREALKQKIAAGGFFKIQSQAPAEPAAAS